MLEKSLLDLLVCPETKGPLIYRREQNELWSVEARLAYKVQDDIPVLISAFARELSHAELEGLKTP